MTKSAETWVIAMEEATPDAPGTDDRAPADPGIIDVHSGSPGQGPGRHALQGLVDEVDRRFWISESRSGLSSPSRPESRIGERGFTMVAVVIGMTDHGDPPAGRRSLDRDHHEEGQGEGAALPRQAVRPRDRALPEAYGRFPTELKELSRTGRGRSGSSSRSRCATASTGMIISGTPEASPDAGIGRTPGAGRPRAAPGTRPPSPTRRRPGPSSASRAGTEARPDRRSPLDLHEEALEWRGQSTTTSRRFIVGDADRRSSGSRSHGAAPSTPTSGASSRATPTTAARNPIRPSPRALADRSRRPERLTGRRAEREVRDRREPVMVQKFVLDNGPPS